MNKAALVGILAVLAVVLVGLFSVGRQIDQSRLCLVSSDEEATKRLKNISRKIMHNNHINFALNLARKSWHLQLTKRRWQMPRIKGPRKVHRYSEEFKVAAVKASWAPGV